VGVRSYEPPPLPVARRSAGPGGAAAFAVGTLAFLLLVANGRPIGGIEDRGAARWLVGALAALVSPFAVVDATSRALVAKVLAALLAATAGAFLFAAAARRHALDDARWAAMALALGSTLAAAAQGAPGEAAGACAVAAAVWLLVRADLDDDPSPAAAAGLPLALAVAFQPSALVLAVTLALAVLARWRRAALLGLVWALPGAALAVAAALTGPPARTTSSPGPALLALLVSPAKGALLFAPVALVGLVGVGRALRPSPRGRTMWDQRTLGRWLPASCALAAIGHFLWLAVEGGWADGVFWGPRLVSPAWPLVLVFVPEGLALLGFGGTLLVVASVLVQAIGALTYDGRWDRLRRGPGGRLDDAAWDWVGSPMPFEVGEGVLRPSLPVLEGHRLVVREHALVPRTAQGSFVRFGDGGLRPTGADDTMTSLRLEGGAKVEKERLELSAVGDAIAFRVREGARPRRLEVRVVGRGQGTLALCEKGLWKGARWRERSVNGAFRLRLPYSYAESGAEDLVLALRSGGPVSIESVALVPPTEPENVIRLP
jgi:hypothetical protein